MSDQVSLPNPVTASKVLTEILGKKVTVASSPVPCATPVSITAEYSDGQGNPIAVLIIEPKLAVCLGAALLLMPSAGALDIAKNDDIAETMGDTLHEVFNIAAQIFRGEEAQHRIVLGDVYYPKGNIPPELVASIKASKQRLNTKTTIADYTTGKMSFVLV